MHNTTWSIVAFAQQATQPRVARGSLTKSHCILGVMGL